MTIVNRMAAQGDLLIRRISALPAGLAHIKHASEVIVAHSETGHHHVAVAERPPEHLRPETDWDGLVSYLLVADPVTLEHRRPYDTHAPLTLPPGIYELRRQREYTPEGWRRVED